MTSSYPNIICFPRMNLEFYLWGTDIGGNGTTYNARLHEGNFELHWSDSGDISIYGRWPYSGLTIMVDQCCSLPDAEEKFIRKMGSSLVALLAIQQIVETY